MDILTFSFETIVVFSDIFVSVIEIIGVSSNCLQLRGTQITCRYKKHENIFLTQNVPEYISEHSDFAFVFVSDPPAYLI